MIVTEIFKKSVLRPLLETSLVISILNLAAVHLNLNWTSQIRCQRLTNNRAVVVSFGNDFFLNLQQLKKHCCGIFHHGAPSALLDGRAVPDNDLDCNEKATFGHIKVIWLF